MKLPKGLNEPALSEHGNEAVHMESEIFRPTIKLIGIEQKNYLDLLHLSNSSGVARLFGLGGGLEIKKGNKVWGFGGGGPPPLEKFLKFYSKFQVKI